MLAHRLADRVGNLAGFFLLRLACFRMGPSFKVANEMFADRIGPQGRGLGDRLRNRSQHGLRRLRPEHGANESETKQPAEGYKAPSGERAPTHQPEKLTQT